MQTLNSATVVSLLAVVSFGQAVEHKPPLLSVCELIEHRNEYNGELVAVRATLEGTSEGMWLTAAKDCKYRLVTKGFTWPNAISLEYPNNNSDNPLDHADFDVDWKAVYTLGAVVPQGFNRETDEVVKTYVGLFQTYGDLENRVSSENSHAFKDGFGHLGGLPGRILVKTVRDVRAVRRSDLK
jgi:hypothetical protein